MTKLGKIWTDSVAYVALLTGAGLSIAGNVADTFRTRGPQTDGLDIVLAVAYPALVVLMVEVFVSARWRGLLWPMQCLRWLGTLAITAVAMRVSWVHLHELMLSRGQIADVATLGPLAIDFLAIMATALILAGRGQVATVASRPQESATADGYVATVAMATNEELATVATTEYGQATFRGHGDHPWPLGHEPGQPWDDDGHGHERGDCADGHGHRGYTLDLPATATEFLATQPMSMQYAATLAAELDAWDKGVDTAIQDAGQELATQVDTFLRPAAARVPDEARVLLLAWDPAALTSKEVDALLAAHFGKATRTTRRWRHIVLNTPTSGGR